MLYCNNVPITIRPETKKYNQQQVSRKSRVRLKRLSHNIVGFHESSAQTIFLPTDDISRGFYFLCY